VFASLVCGVEIIAGCAWLEEADGEGGACAVQLRGEMRGL
jgi:hypothetical protein